MRIAIMTDDPGWHGRELKRAFSARGAQVRYVSLAACRFDLASATEGLCVPGFEARLPDGVFVRAIAAGTFEQVTLRLDFLHALSELGVPVYNSARGIEKSVDKAMTSFLLRRAGIATPQTWVCEDAQAARTIVRRETAAGREVVLKPLFGSQGAGLRRLRAGEELPAASEFHGVYYLQRFLDSGEGRWHDWRVFVVGDRPIAAMIRRGKSWISNIAQGARAESAALAEEITQLALGATRAVGLRYAGVDIMRAPDGRYSVVEVNSIPAWKGLQKVTPFNIAEVIAAHFLDHTVALTQPARRASA